MPRQPPKPAPLAPMSSKTETRVERTLSFDRTILVDALNQMFRDINIPPGATVFVEVPGNVDFSGVTLCLDEDTQLQVSWTTVKVE